VITTVILSVLMVMVVVAFLIGAGIAVAVLFTLVSALSNRGD
jgi:hypothetical protein